MRLQDVHVGQRVECQIGYNWYLGVVEAVNQPTKCFPDGYVQVNTNVMAYLGPPGKVRLQK